MNRRQNNIMKRENNKLHTNPEKLKSAISLEPR
jgi:hypothetical protein